MQTLSLTLEATLARRARNVAFLSSERPTSHTLDTIAECEGRAAACRILLALPVAERRDHAVRLLCESAQASTVHGSALLIRAAEMELYADAATGRLTLT